MSPGGAAMRSHALLTLCGVALVSLLVVDAGSAWARATGGGASAYTGQGGSSGAVVEAPSAPSDVERGVAFIRQMDPGFDPAAFAQWAQRAFSDVQDAIARRDLATVADRLTPQEFARLQGQCDQLRGARQTNRVEQIRWRRAEVSEAWQESGQDWVTVYLAASLVDYTVDDTTGALVDGSKTPQDIEEYWNFTGLVGPTPWRLSAIQAA